MLQAGGELVTSNEKETWTSCEFVAYQVVWGSGVSSFAGLGSIWWVSGAW